MRSMEAGSVAGIRAIYPACFAAMGDRTESLQKTRNTGGVGFVISNTVVNQTN